MFFDASSVRPVHFGLRTFAALLTIPITLLAVGCGDDEGGGSKDADPPTPAERLCTLVEEAIASCEGKTPCDDAMVRDCASVTSILSDPLLESAAACIEAGGSPGSCLASATGSIQPTDAHRAFAAQFCSECLLGVPGCEDAFFSGTGDTQLASLAVLPFGDDVVNQVTAECATGLTCAATLPSCAQGVLAAQALPQDTISCMLGQLSGGLLGGGEGTMGDVGGSCGASTDTQTSTATDTTTSTDTTTTTDTGTATDTATGT